MKNWVNKILDKFSYVKGLHKVNEELRKSMHILNVENSRITNVLTNEEQNQAKAMGVIAYLINEPHLICEDKHGDKYIVVRDVDMEKYRSIGLVTAREFPMNATRIKVQMK